MHLGEFEVQLIAETYLHSPGCDMQGRAGIGRGGLGAQRNGADVSQQLSKGKDYRRFFYHKVLDLHMKSNRDTGYLVVEAAVVELHRIATSVFLMFGRNP